MIRVLIDDVSPHNARKGNRRKRLYELEIVPTIEFYTGNMSYSVWLNEPGHSSVQCGSVAYPESDVLKLVAAALQKAEIYHGL